MHLEGEDTYMSTVGYALVHMFSLPRFVLIKPSQDCFGLLDVVIIMYFQTIRHHEMIEASEACVPPHGIERALAGCVGSRAGTGLGAAFIFGLLRFRHCCDFGGLSLKL